MIMEQLRVTPGCCELPEELNIQAELKQVYY